MAELLTDISDQFIGDSTDLFAACLVKPLEEINIGTRKKFSFS